MFFFPILHTLSDLCMVIKRKRNALHCEDSWLKQWKFTPRLWLLGSQGRAFSSMKSIFQVLNWAHFYCSNPISKKKVNKNYILRLCWLKRSCPELTHPFIIRSILGDWHWPPVLWGVASGLLGNMVRSDSRCSIHVTLHIWEFFISQKLLWINKI